LKGGHPVLPNGVESGSSPRNFAANLISAGVRLIPLGQTDGPRLTAPFRPGTRGPAGDMGCPS
jgi:hypothetical protein